MEEVIKTQKVLLEHKMVLKNGKATTIKGYSFRITKDDYEVYKFDTEIGEVLPKEVKEIL